MQHLKDLDKYPIEKRVSVFMRNDRESPKGQRLLPANQTSYVLRDLYPFRNEVGFFAGLLTYVYAGLAGDDIHIVELRAIDSMVYWIRWWNKLMGLLHLRKLICYGKNGYSWHISRVIKKDKLTDKLPYIKRQWRMEKEEKQKYVAYPYARSVYILHYSYDNIYGEVVRRYLFEREKDNPNIHPMTKLSLETRWPRVDPRGPGLRIYPVYEEFSHLQGEALVEAYLDSEPMMELILARCEQEVEIRINESLISVEEVIERIRKGMEPMQWRLEVRL